MAQLQHTISPIDGRIYISRALATHSEIESCLQRASEARTLWSKMTLKERKVICWKALAWLELNKKTVSEEICWQMGRPVRYASVEIDKVIERAFYMIEVSEKALSPLTITGKSGFTRYITREPVGVVFVIAPWNYPYLTAINSLIPALLAGNCVILKHSAQTPLCAERLVEAFKAVGLPEGVFQYLHLSHQDTRLVIQSGQVNHIAFTGSVEGGKEIEQAAAGHFVSVGLELGGKDPAYVREDADLTVASESIIDGAYFNSGQSCCGIERIYVHELVFDEFVSKAVELVEAYKLGRSNNMDTTLGPLVHIGAAEFVRGQIKEAIEQGAVAHIDPLLFPASNIDSPYVAPQLLTQVDHSMRIMTEETFGPVVGIMKVSSDQEAIDLMNDSQFGLTASIFTRDIEAGVVLGEQLETGTFFVNRCDYLDPALAWTGIKQSGRGHALSELGFDAMTRPKSFHIKHAR